MQKSQQKFNQTCYAIFILILFVIFAVAFSRAKSNNSETESATEYELRGEPRI